MDGYKAGFQATRGYLDFLSRNEGDEFAAKWAANELRTRAADDWTRGSHEACRQVISERLAREERPMSDDERRVREILARSEARTDVSWLCDELLKAWGNER